MSTISLNILKSYPLNNINSDENKVPKNAKIYGVNRIYQSSQCWNRAVKEHYSHGKISAYNTKHVDELTKMICREMELDDDKTNLCVSEITKFITGKDKTNKAKKTKNTKVDNTEDTNTETKTADSVEQEKKDTLNKVSVNGIKNMIKYILSVEDGKFDKNELKNCYMNVDDGDVIAFFGNMNASNSALNVDSVVSTAHAFTTHEAYPVGNIFTGDDDFRMESAGAGHVGRSYYGGGVIYRSVLIDVDMFMNSSLMSTSKDPTVNANEKKKKLVNLIRSEIMANPSGMSAKAQSNVTIGFAVGLTFPGEGYSYADAFETPVPDSETVAQDSVDRLTRTIESKNCVFELNPDAVVAIHDVNKENHSDIQDAKNITEFIETLIAPCFK